MPQMAMRATPNKWSNEQNNGCAVHVHFESWNISLLSSAKHHCEMTKFYIFWRTQTTMADFWYLLFKLNAVGDGLPEQVFRPIGILNRSAQL